MTLRTHRRRISPRTKQRYRVIKGFFRRALGNSSPPGTKTSSSIEVSVSELKSQITGIEQQLNTVSKHCQDLTSLEHTFTRESLNSVAQTQQDDEAVGSQENCETIVDDIETKLLYKSSSSQQRKLECDNIINKNRDDTDNMASRIQSATQNIPVIRLKQKDIELKTKRREKNDFHAVDQGRPHSKYNTNGSVYSTSSFHSLVEPGNRYYSKPGCSSNRHEKKYLRKEHVETIVLKEHREKEALKKFLRNNEREYDDRYKYKRTKRDYSEIDRNFIDDIIKRQYKPLKLFGRRESDFSQFSAPVCRDQEFPARNEIQEGIELCSCCNDKCRRRHRSDRNTDISDIRSICDTRLYSSKRNRRRKVKTEYVDDYNNSAFYDVVPVKEKSSPKAKRKFNEDNIISYQYCKEVPPSPRSHRPRLNLKVQHYEDYEDNLNGGHKSRKNSPAHEFRKKITSIVESVVSSEPYTQRPQAEILNSAKSQRPVQIHEDVGTMSSLQYPHFANEQVNIQNNDATLNTQFTDFTADKTDKTLSEIKDILRTFLLEIKKESTYSNRSEDTSKIENKQLTGQENVSPNSNFLPNSGHSSNNYSQGQCGIPPFIPAFPNPCCYPILPVCPMNCMQNGYIMPTPSYTCNMCAKASREHFCPDKDSFDKNKPTENNKTSNETQELIKEIYKFVLQKPISPRTTAEGGNENHSTRSKKHLYDKNFETNRYVGGGRSSKHDANVGTPHLKCYSKSCEAIGSKITSNTYITSASYSDTILEKLSLEVTHSSTDSTTDVPEEKVKRPKLTKVLNPLRLFRKKKKDVIEELSESDSTAEVKVKPKPPFQQQIQNYAMHGQEYFHPPPSPAQHCCHSPRQEYYGHSYGPRNCCPPPSGPPDVCNHPKQHHTPAPYYNPKYPISSPYPNYNPHYNQIPPQVPVCLKEIEVKSIGTQSDRKVSILQKIANKIPAQQSRDAAPVKPKTNFWKSLQEKSRPNDNDPVNFSLNTRKRLEQGDTNMRNVMVKKLFTKRNPFSPRNLIVRTLLGKDQSSYGNPPKMYRPRMFL